MQNKKMDELLALYAAFSDRMREQGMQEPIVPGEGPVEAKILLLGEAPGAEEAKVGRPFVGKAGKNLDAFLAQKSGETRSRIQNLIKDGCVRRNGKAPGKAGEKLTAGDEIELTLHGKPGAAGRFHRLFLHRRRGGEHPRDHRMLPRSQAAGSEQTGISARGGEARGRLRPVALHAYLQ